MDGGRYLTAGSRAVTLITKVRFLARRIGANIAKLPELRQGDVKA